jgi:hypothetical protein
MIPVGAKPDRNARWGCRQILDGAPLSAIDAVGMGQLPTLFPEKINEVVCPSHI